MKKVTEKLSLIERLNLLLRGEIPTSLKSSRWRRIGDETESGAESLSVDDLHGIIQEAKDGHCERLFALYRDVIASDSHLQAEFGKRKLAVLGDVLSIQPRNDEQPDDVAAAESIQALVDDLSGWTRSMAHLLDSILYPVSILEKVYRVVDGRYELAELFPVDHQLIDLRDGTLKIYDTDPAEGRALQTSHAPDKGRYIIHRGHILSQPDRWGGPMRSILFWWLLSTMDLTWWAQFLDKYGSPFMLGKYDTADDASRSTLERAFAFAKKIGGLVVTKETHVELVEAAKGETGDAYEKFLSICQREKSKLVLGQTLSAEAQATGLGSGVSNTQEDVRQDIRQFDGRLLGQTLRDQLFTQFIEINGSPGRAPQAIWGADSADDQEISGDLINALSQAGYELTDDGLSQMSQRIGLPLQRKADMGTDDNNTPIPFSAKNPGDVRALKATTEDPEDAIVRVGSADLAQAFRGNLAPVRQLILLSSSQEDLEEKLRTHYADYSPGRIEQLITDALTAFAANAAATVNQN